MVTIKSPKVTEKFSCDKCNYRCSKKSDYNKHLMTTKHLMVTNDNKKSPKVATIHICDCGKKFKFRSGLSRHKRSCLIVSSDTCITTTNDNSTILNIISQNKELMNLLITKNHQTDELIQQNREMQKQNKEMQKTMLEIVPKMGNNNTTNNTNNFNLQVFLNEDCKDAINFSDFIKQIQVSFEDVENQAENGYVKGISKLFIENLKELGTHKRPIHCTDKKRKTLYIKENDEWDKEGSQDTLKNGIQEVTRSTMRTLIKEKENRAEEFADMESEFSMKCLSIQRNLIPTAPRETAFSKVMENITKTSTLDEK